MIQRPNSLDCEDVHCNRKDHSDDRDGFILDIISAAIEASHECIPMSGGNKSKSGKLKPGWKDKVKPFQIDAKFWYGTWKAAGKPNTGDLFTNMIRSRNQFHYAIRRNEKELDTIKANYLNNAANADDRTFLLELKKTLSKRKTKQKVPNFLVFGRRT